MITTRKQIERLLAAEIRAPQPDFGAIEYLTSLLRKSLPGVGLQDTGDGLVNVQPMNITVGHNYGQHEYTNQKEAAGDNLAATLQGILQMQRLTASLEALRCLTALGANGGDPALLSRAQELAQTMLGSLTLPEAADV